MRLLGTLWRGIARLEPLLAPLRRHPRALVGMAIVLTVCSWFAAGMALRFAYDVSFGLPDTKAVRGIGDMAQATIIFDLHNRPVFTIFKEQRIEIPLTAVSPHLINGLIAIEDQRFFDHKGVDIVRIGAAVLANVRAQRNAQGGSTITQQLARQSFLSRDKTYRRKLKEVVLAALIERTYTKGEILALYLNKVYFGDGFYGVEAAALGYFGKHASEVSVAEAALLAGLVQSPSAYAPTINPDRAVVRRNMVLQAMLDRRQIDQSTWDQARRARVRLRNALQKDEPYGLYFKEEVRQELVNRFGWERVYQGGLRVYTTIDSELQQLAERTLEAGLDQVEGRKGFKHPRRQAEGAAPAGNRDSVEYLQGAFVVIDPSTGHVLTLVGGRDFRDSRFNRATQAKRQPGSAFKPFVYAAAIESGLTPATVLDRLDDPVLTVQGAWTPDDEHSGATALTMRAALRTSSNRAAVRVIRDVGIVKTVGYAERLGLNGLPRVPSLALGAGEVTLVSLTNAFAAFANGGIVRAPTTVRRVEDADGIVVFRGPTDGTRAISETTAFLMANMLADVVNSGTGYRARQSGFTLPAAGKTGTTNDFVDAWFVGFTPRLAAGVWLGFDQPQTIVSNGYAGDLAVPMWGQFMKVATKNHEPRWLNRPKNISAVSACRVSGKRPTPGCEAVEVLLDNGQPEIRSMVYTEYFVRGTEPREDCPVHAATTILDRVIAAFGGGEREQPPVRAESVGLPRTPSQSSPRTTSGMPPEKTESKVEPENPEPEKKKKGFWSRVGRIFKGDNDQDKKKPEKKKPNN